MWKGNSSLTLFSTLTPDLHSHKNLQSTTYSIQSQNISQPLPITSAVCFFQIHEHPKCILTLLFTHLSHCKYLISVFHPSITLVITVTPSAPSPILYSSNFLCTLSTTHSRVVASKASIITFIPFLYKMKPYMHSLSQLAPYWSKNRL